MEKSLEFLQTSFFGISLAQLGLAFVFILGGYILRFMLVSGINRTLNLIENSQREFEKMFLSSILKPLGVFAVTIGLWLAARILPLPEEPVDIHSFVHALLRSGFVVITIWLGVRLTNGVSQFLLKKTAETPSPLDDQLVPVGRNTLKAFIIVIGAVIILQDLGYSVSSLLAGLGLGGMAIAFASKDTLANIFGSMVIFIDRPFHVGDWIEMGDIEGRVEEVGLRVTRIRTFANSLITMPNASLTTQPINNWSRMKKRRIRFNLGLTYDTTPEKMEMAVEALRNIIREDPNMDHEFYIVNFTNFGAYSLDILIYCFTTATRGVEHNQAKQDLFLKFMKAIKDLELEFAFPTQTLYHANEGTDRLSDK